MRILAGLFLAALLLAGCGKKGPLVYPDMLVPAAPADVTAQQRGASMKLSLVLPSRDLAGRTFSGLAGVKIFKRDETAGQIPGCNACTTGFALFKTLNLELLPPGVQRSGSLVLLLDSDVEAGRSYVYRVQTFTGDNREGAASTSAAVAMVPAPLPPILQAFSQPTEIHLEFTTPPPRDGVIAGYNIYRTTKGETFSLIPLNRAPIAGNRYVDVGLERATVYIYAVRSVVRLPAGVMIESLASNEVEARLKDDE